MCDERESLFPALREPSDREAVRFGERALTYAQLAGSAAAMAERVAGARRVAVWATSTLETCVSVVGALSAGVGVVPINPKVGERELAHIVNDSDPDLLLAEPGFQPPEALAEVPLHAVDVAARSDALPA